MHARTDKVVEGIQSIGSWKKWRKLFKWSHSWNPDSCWACHCYKSPSKVKLLCVYMKLIDELSIICVCFWGLGLVLVGGWQRVWIGGWPVTQWEKTIRAPCQNSLYRFCHIYSICLSWSSFCENISLEW